MSWLERTDRHMELPLIKPIYGTSKRDLEQNTGRKRLSAARGKKSLGQLQLTLMKHSFVKIAVMMRLPLQEQFSNNDNKH